LGERLNGIQEVGGSTTYEEIGSMNILEIPEDDYSPANVEAAQNYYVVLSGCSGAGKSSLLRELARRGYRVFAEPVRQIIKEQTYIGGDALPGKDFYKLVELSVSRSMNNMISAAAARSHVFFDRSIVDMFSGLERMKVSVPTHLVTAVQKFKYNRKVFITPPWREIFCNDNERTHSFDDSVAEYAMLLKTYPRLGYELILVPKVSVPERADFVLHQLGLSDGKNPS
jgi:predicted ATPase